jgi:hypothetical protein
MRGGNRAGGGMGRHPPLRGGIPHKLTILGLWRIMDAREGPMITPVARRHGLYARRW